MNTATLKINLQERERFDRLANKWKSETLPLSSQRKIAEHPAYQEIIGMGMTALPLILEDLDKEANFWFEALTRITGEQPIPNEHFGKIEAMRQDWLNWGRAHGL